MVSWQLTKGTSFEKVRSRLVSLNIRTREQGTIVSAFYVDNCCMWRNKLQDVFGADLSVKLDLFHAVQRVIKKIPKRYQKETRMSFIRQRMMNDLWMVFRMSSDIGPTRMNDTPSPAEI